MYEKKWGGGGTDNEVFQKPYLQEYADPLGLAGYSKEFEPPLPREQQLPTQRYGVEFINVIPKRRLPNQSA